MDLGIKGKWALVGGASKGLGWGCARALALEGVNVVMVARADGTLAADVRPLIRLSVTVIAEQNGRREVGSAGGGGSSGRFDLDSNCPNTRAVDKPRPGLTKQAKRGGTLPRGDICAPIPCINTGRRPIQTGTSAPNSTCAATSGRGRSQSAAIACNVAAASALPPPIPEATGMVLCSRMPV